MCGGTKDVGMYGETDLEAELQNSCHSLDLDDAAAEWEVAPELPMGLAEHAMTTIGESRACLLYTSDAADE